MKISRRGLLLAPLALAVAHISRAQADDDGTWVDGVFYSKKCRFPLGEARCFYPIDDKTLEMCRTRFPNTGTFRGFPDSGVYYRAIANPYRGSVSITRAGKGVI